MNEPAAFGTNKEKPWYFDNPDRPVNIKPLWCNLSSNWESPPYETWAVYLYGKDAVSFTIIL